MSKRNCLVEGCTKTYYAKGYCKGHYEQWRKYGEVVSDHLQEHGHLKPGDREKIISMLEETTLTCKEIGSVFDVSRGPVYKIQQECGMKRRGSKGEGSFRRCETCGKVFKRDGHQIRLNRGKYCSKQCYTVWQKSEANRGSNNPGWVDGGKHETEMNRLRKTDEWRTWRDSVYKRDDYTCSICGQKGGQLHPHHIKKKSLYPELVFDSANGITLCKDCHHLEGVHVNEGLLEKRFLEMSAI